MDKSAGTSLKGNLLLLVTVLVPVGDVLEAKEVVSIVVKDENVLNRLLRLLENVMDPYALLGGKGGAETSSELPILGA